MVHAFLVKNLSWLDQKTRQKNVCGKCVDLIHREYVIDFVLLTNIVAGKILELSKLNLIYHS